MKSLYTLIALLGISALTLTGVGCGQQPEEPQPAADQQTEESTTAQEDEIKEDSDIQSDQFLRNAIKELDYAAE